eukprot:Em0013g293a
MGGCFPREAPPDFSGPVDFSHFHILRAVGKGAFGKVSMHCEEERHEAMYAMKYMNKIQIIAKHAVENVFREQELLSALEHPFLVNLWFTFQDAEDIFMVMDLMLGGDLSYHLTREGRFAVPRVVLYVAEMALVLEYLQGKQIIHRDMKPANMLLDLQGHVHLSDFNVACVVKAGVPVTSVTGTKPYMAPEVIHPGTKGYSYAVDWWSLGVSAYEMLRGQRPFHVEKGMTNDEIYAMLKHSHPTASAKWDENVCDLLQRLLHPDERKRLQSVKKAKELKCFQDLNWDDIEQGKATPSFIPPQNRINCDPTHELEEMIVEPNPLHKKATRLSKRQPRCEDEKTQAALDKINKEFITYNRIKDRAVSDEWRKKSNALEVNVECDLRTERVSFVEPTTARASEPYQTRSSTTNMECDQQDRIENVEREGAELCTVIKVVAADVHDELPHLQAQTLLNASNEHGSKDDRREGEEGSCAAVEVTADVHKEVPHHTTLTGDVDQGSESTPLLVEVTLGSHQKGSSPQTELVPAQIQVALGLVLNSAPDCTLGAALDASANCTLPEQTEALADPYDIHVNHLQATPPEPDMPQETENAIVDCNVMSPTTQGKTDHLFVIGDTSVITTVGVGHADQSIREVPSDLNMTVGCKGQVDSTSEIIPLLNTVA